MKIFRIYKLHLLVLKMFISPFLAGFSVSLFILVLEFLARYQSDIFGKGFPAVVIAKLFFYAMIPMVVMALPIALLLSSLMTMGKMGEQYELVAVKSAGINVFKVIIPLLFFGVIVSGISFYFAAELIPKANLKLYSLLYDIEQTKPKFKLKPGFFNYTIDKFVIRASDKNEQGIYKDVLIYEHTGKPGNLKTITAETANIYADYNTLYLHFFLYNGYRYEEAEDNYHPRARHPHYKIRFDTLHYRVDISDLGFHKTDESLFASHRYMLNLRKLKTSVDSLQGIPDTVIKDLEVYYDKYMHFSLLEKIPHYDKSVVPFQALRKTSYYNAALNDIRNINNYLDFVKDRYKNALENVRKYEVEYYMKWMFPVSCLVFIMLGAPLGAIIRKGGLGASTVVSILFFIVFYVLMTQGKKLAVEGVLPTAVGVWLPIIVLLPVAMLVNYQVIQDVHFLQELRDKFLNLFSFSFHRKEK